MMSGLTLAIFSLDLTSLRVLMAAGTEKEKKYASKIMPLAERQYLVLVSLVLANAMAVEAMPLLLDRISSPYIAMLVSVTAVLLFAEVLPQAVCGRYGLLIGYMFHWLVWGIIGFEFVIAYPISLVLEKCLGKNYGTFYRRAELQALVDFHGPSKISLKPETPDSQELHSPFEHTNSDSEECLTNDEVQIIKGALQMTTKCALDAMVKLDDIFMMSKNDIFDRTALTNIMEFGHSRIPIYGETKQDILGILLMKRLIVVDPYKVTKVSELLTDQRFFYPVFWIDGNMPLYVLLNRFQEGYWTHMAFVREQVDEEKYAVLGMVTLEDVLEEILQEEIFDERDVYSSKATNNNLMTNKTFLKVTHEECLTIGRSRHPHNKPSKSSESLKREIVVQNGWHRNMSEKFPRENGSSQ